MRLNLSLVEATWLTLYHNFLGPDHGLNVVLPFAHRFSHVLTDDVVVEDLGSDINQSTKDTTSMDALTVTIGGGPVRTHPIHLGQTALIKTIHVVALLRRLQLLVLDLSAMTSASCYAATRPCSRRLWVKSDPSHSCQSLSIWSAKVATGGVSPDGEVLLRDVAS